ncbi:MULTISPECIES: SurA N-terminal domain-containing protein [unclassified Acinetobacter]|uniref:SurA N-terminal domain-containing protein n=1 Tax=unclassified Acinetobacter TaxID=196816 RepID=UPI0035B6EC71
METFRRLMRGWLGKVLLVAFLTPLALTGVDQYFNGGSQYAAKVNGEKISQTDLDQRINQQRGDYLQMLNGDSSLINDAVLQEQTLNAMIMQQLLLQQADKLGINLSDAQIADILRTIPDFQENGQFSQARFEAILKQQGLSVDQLIASQRQRDVITLLMDSIIKATPYSNNTRQALIAMLAQERVSHIAEIDLNQFAQNFTATDAQAKAYYDQHQKQFILPAAVDVSYVVASPRQFAEKVEVSEEEIQAQYNRYVAEHSKDAKREVSHILVTTEKHSPEQAQALANEINAKLKAGISFASLVQQYSEDPASKAQSGKITGYSVGVFGDEFDRAVVGLAQGQVSAPIKTQYGYHLIRLDNVEGLANVQPLADIRAEVTAQAKLHKAEQEFAELVNQATDAGMQADNLTPIAEKFKTTVQSAKAFTQATANPILANPSVRGKLFSSEVAHGDHNVSTAITLPNHDIVWVKVASYRAEAQQSFEQAKTQVMQAVKREEQIKQARASIDASLKALASQPASSAIAQSKLNFRDLGPVPRFGRMLPQSIERAIYSVAAPKEGQWSVTTADSGDKLYVIGVSAVQKNPQFNLDAQQTAQLTDRYDPRGQLILNDYTHYLRDNAKVKIHTTQPTTP